MLLSKIKTIYVFLFHELHKVCFTSGAAGDRSGFSWF